jgi:hypothetical protein
VKVLIRPLHLLAFAVTAAGLLVVASPATAGVLPQPEERIVYRCSSGSGQDLCLIGPDGTGFVQLTDDGTGTLSLRYRRRGARSRGGTTSQRSG